MVTLADMLQLPEGEEEAFVEFEALCRSKMEAAIARCGLNDSEWPYRLEYMSRVSAAASEFGLDESGALDPLNNRYYTGDDFDSFSQEIFGIVTRTQIRARRHAARGIVEWEPSDKAKLLFQINRLKKQVEEAVDIDEGRKKALVKKLDELIGEVQGSRGNLTRVMVLLAATAALLNSCQGTVIKGPETYVAIMDMVSLATAKQEERRALFERYRKPLAIEDRSEPEPSKVPSGDLDDEIPF